MEEELKCLKDHFKQELNLPDPLNSPDLADGPELPIRIGNITKIEIRDALKRLKNSEMSKDAGHDNIPVEAIKLKREEIYQSTSCTTSLTDVE